MQRLLRWIERLLRGSERVATAFTLGLAAIVFANVLLRYLFQLSAMAVQELQWYFYAFSFLLAIAPTLWADQHVRIDIFYGRLPASWQRWINFWGTLLLMVPFAVLVLWASYDFVAYSFRIRESSPNPGGLPWLFLFKAALPVSFLLLLLAALALLWRWGRSTDKAPEREGGRL